MRSNVRSWPLATIGFVIFVVGVAGFTTGVPWGYLVATVGTIVLFYALGLRME
jgi:uncharacterized membrane protein